MRSRQRARRDEGKKKKSTTKMKLRQPGGARQFGQTSLPLSFSKSRFPTEDLPTKPLNKQSVSLSEFLSRKLVKTTSTSVKEKQTSFSAIGSVNKESLSEKDGNCGRFALNDAIFQKFKVSVEGKEHTEAAEGGESKESQLESSAVAGDAYRKRKNRYVSSGDHEKLTARKSLVILGDDPKPWPIRRVKKMKDNRSKPFYDHYASGSGWWDCSKEGIDNEEVGCNEFWEGMGSTTLGGLEWH